MENNWQVEGWNEWGQLADLGSWNWINATLIKISGEVTRYLGSAEITLVVLGLGVRVSYTYDRRTETRLKLEKAMEDFQDATSVVVSAREYDKLKTAADNWYRMQKE